MWSTTVLKCLQLHVSLEHEQNKLIIKLLSVSTCVEYFSGYKMEVFSIQNIHKNLDQLDVDLWDCLGRVKFVL